MNNFFFCIGKRDKMENLFIIQEFLKWVYHVIIDFQRFREVEDVLERD